MKKESFSSCPKAKLVACGTRVLLGHSPVSGVESNATQGIPSLYYFASSYHSEKL